MGTEIKTVEFLCVYEKVGTYLSVVVPDSNTKDGVIDIGILCNLAGVRSLEGGDGLVSRHLDCHCGCTELYGGAFFIRVTAISSSYGQL